MHAALIGDTIDIRWAFPSFGSTFASTSVLVGGGVKITCPGGDPLCAGFVGGVTFDIGDLSITHTHLSSSTYDAVSYNGFAYTSLDTGGGGITGYILSTNIAGLDGTRITFGADNININLQALAVTNGSFYTLDLQTGAVPEPSTVLLIATGLVALLWRRRAALT
ncbi:MAG: PEP-CTERM sorting domain-containing protein [Bryobacteraceae bacterium]